MQRILNRKLLYWLGPVVLVAGSIAVWRLLPIPFGPTFEFWLQVAVIGLILTLFVPAIPLLQRRTPWGFVSGGILALLSVTILIVGALCHVDYALLPVFDIPRNLTAEQWHEDLMYLASEMPQKHPGLFSLVSEDRFTRAVDDLDRRLSSLDETQIKAELTRMVALPGDAHTFPNVFSTNLDWHVFPISFMSSLRVCASLMQGESGGT